MHSIEIAELILQIDRLFPFVMVSGLLFVGWSVLVGRRPLRPGIAADIRIGGGGSGGGLGSAGYTRMPTTRLLPAASRIIPNY